MSNPLLIRISIILLHSSSDSIVVSALCNALLSFSKAPEESNKSMMAGVLGDTCVTAKSMGVWPSLLMRLGSAP